MKVSIIVRACLVLKLVLCQNEAEIDYYENLINSENAQAINYTLPSDASMYLPNSQDPGQIQHYGDFDFIVVGSGATGSVIASRLSEIGRWKILLLEAGKFETNFTDIPNVAYSVRLSEYNWAYKSIPQNTSCLAQPNQECPVDRGRGIGGTTLFNGLLYSRANRVDFHRWEKLGNPGWSYSDVLPYYKRSENLRVYTRSPEAVIDPLYHDYSGPWDVEYHRPTNQFLDRFIEANQEQGYDILDYNGANELGASDAQLNIDHGKRADNGNAFINPIKKRRRNLKIKTESYVTKILINKDKRAYGVQFSHNKTIYSAFAKNEVIISAGAVNSPQLLMLSGIGPKDHLDSLGIAVVSNLEVGSEYRNHETFKPLNFKTNYSIPDKSLRGHIIDYLNGVGSLAHPYNLQALGFYRTTLGQKDFPEYSNYPDLELLLIPNYGYGNYSQELLNAAKDKTWSDFDPAVSFSLVVIHHHPKSYGTLRLKSNNPYQYPIIDTNYLSDPDDFDIESMYEGVQIGLKLVDSEAFRSINTTLYLPPAPACDQFQYLSKQFWFCMLRQFTTDTDHILGTCPMGPDPRKGFVVDSNAKVHGVKGLRVADASVIPFPITAHTTATCTMIGEKVSDLIILQNLLD